MVYVVYFLVRKYFKLFYFILFKSGEIYSLHEHIAQSSPSVGSVPPIDRKFSDPEFLPVPESIARGDEGTAFLGVKYQGRVARW
jgi:hypothetical protein